MTSPTSVAQVLINRCLTSRQQTAFLVKESSHWKEISWGEVGTRLRSIVTGLQACGVAPRDRVAIVSKSSFEWALVDFSSLLLGLATVPIYPSLLESEIQFVLTNSRVKVVFVESRQQLEKIKLIWQNCPLLKTVVVMDRSVSEETVSCGRILGLQLWEQQTTGGVEGLETLSQGLRPEDIMTVVYTSGTTGEPKGACLSHRCFLSLLPDFVRFGLSGEDRTLTFLPFSHILGRFELYLPVFHGVQMAFAQDMATLSNDLVTAQPTILISVPRIYEKIYAKIQSKLREEGQLKRYLLGWSLRRAGTGGLKNKVATWVNKKIFYSKIRQSFGGRIRFAVSGGAPLGRELADFFQACGILILEGYGLTETTGPATVNFLESYRMGSVGKPTSDMEMKIASDGEVLLRGSALFTQYDDNEVATREALDEQGWFHSGDIGELREGFLFITDRKKDLIVTSGGKKIAPQYIENLIKNQLLMSHAVIVGDRQKYIGALVTLNRQAVEDYARSEGINNQNYPELLKHPKVLQVVNDGVKRVNRQLPNFSMIKKFHVLPVDFTVSTGELTPSLKVKRNVCLEKYRKEIAHLYV